MLAELRLRDALPSLSNCLLAFLPSWEAVPLPLYVALSHGRLGAALVGLLHASRLRELAERAPVIIEVGPVSLLCDGEQLAALHCQGIRL